MTDCLERAMAAKTQGEFSDAGQAKIKHPKYEVMVEEAIVALNSRQGSTRQAVTKHLTEKYQLASATCNTHASKALKACIEKNVIESTTGDLKGKLKLSKDRKEELKKLGKKVEKKVEKMVNEETEKAVKKPPKKPTEKRSSKSDDKENEPSTKKRPEVDEVDDGKETERPKRGKQQDEKEKKLKKSSSTSKIDDMKGDQRAAKSAKGRQKGSVNDEVMTTENTKRKAASKKGSRK